MAITNHETCEINCKILYLGPQGAGKSENLRSILSLLSGPKKNLSSFVTGTNKTVPINFLPLSLGQVKNYEVRLHLYSLPPLAAVGSLSSMLFRGLDGVVFVADSRVEKLKSNIDELYRTDYFLEKEGVLIEQVPQVVQYNKRDIKAGIVDTAVLRQELNPLNKKEKEASAINSVGTMETLMLIAKQVLSSISK